jgi:hypothetical protein
MRAPDMRDSHGEPCLLVVTRGNAIGTTLGCANGIFPIVRDYFSDMSINQTSMEWEIINYDSKSDVFSEPGDSSSIIADICGHIGMLTEDQDLRHDLRHAVLVAPQAYPGQRVASASSPRLLDIKRITGSSSLFPNKCDYAIPMTISIIMFDSSDTSCPLSAARQHRRSREILPWRISPRGLLQSKAGDGFADLGSLKLVTYKIMSAEQSSKLTSEIPDL